jgi:biopolymer transport protein ExbD
MARQALFGGEDPFRAKRKGLEGELDITPMIDCTFLLLIFFMVTSTMQSTADLDLPAAVNSIGVETDGAAIITLFAAQPQQPPRIVLGDVKGEESDLEGVRRYVSQAVADGKRKIVVKAEGDVSHKDVNEVARIIGGVEGAEFYIGVGDKPDD